jgi:hypothetical protein
MKIIDLLFALLYAINGNIVVELPPGRHKVLDKIADIAVNQMLLGAVVEGEDDVLPRITVDVNGQPVSDKDLEEIYGPEEAFPENKTPASSDTEIPAPQALESLPDTNKKRASN